MVRPCFTRGGPSRRACQRALVRGETFNSLAKASGSKNSPASSVGEGAWGTRRILTVLRWLEGARDAHWLQRSKRFPKRCPGKLRCGSTRAAQSCVPTQKFLSYHSGDSWGVSVDMVLTCP